MLLSASMKANHLTIAEHDLGQRVNAMGCGLHCLKRDGLLQSWLTPCKWDERKKPGKASDMHWILHY